MAKRKNWRPRPIPTAKLKTIKNLIVGPDKVEHDFDPEEGWTAKIRELYPGKYMHGDRAFWVEIKEDNNRVQPDGMIYDVQSEDWVLEPHGHEMGPSPNGYLRRKIGEIIEELEVKVDELETWREKLTRIPDGCDSWRDYCPECGNDFW